MDKNQEQSEENQTKDSPRDKKSRNEPENIDMHTDSTGAPGSSFMVAASPPKFVSLKEIMTAADGVGNMALAHEIAVDKEFKIEKREIGNVNSLEHRVNEMMRKAFWDVLQEKLNQDPPDYSHALSLLQEVKESLEGILLPQHVRVRAQIDEVLDLELISQQVEQGTLDFPRYSSFVIATMARLCAPARDEAVEQLKHIEGVVPTFKAILELLDVLKIDMANYTIQQMRPYLREQSIAYEHKKFDEFLQKQKESGVDGLECTKSWIDRSYLRLTERNQSSSEASASSQKINKAQILNNAFIELLDWPENLLFPETLLMDRARFATLESQSHWLALVTSTLLVTYNTVGAAIAGIAELKTKLIEQITAILKGVAESGLEEAMMGVAQQVEKEVCACLEKHGYKPLDEERRELLKKQIQAVRSAEHPVHKIMKSRLENFLRELLVTSGKAADTKIPQGFSSVAKELSHLSGQFLRLTSYNQAVFGPYYAEIVENVLKKHENEGTPV